MQRNTRKSSLRRLDFKCALAVGMMLLTSFVSAQVTENRFELPAEFEPFESVSIVSKIEGFVSEVLVDIGDAVKKGQVLIRLSVPEIVAEVNRQEKLVTKSIADHESHSALVEASRSKLAAQEALMKLKKSALDRVTRLVSAGALREEKQDEAEYAYDSVIANTKSIEADLSATIAKSAGSQGAIGVARAELEKANAMAGYLEIRAPFDGEVTKRMVDVGTYVRPPAGNTKSLLEIVTPQKLRVVLMIPIEHASKVSDGQSVELHDIRGLGDELVEAKIARHARVLNPNTRMMRVEIDLENPLNPESKKRKFRPGDYGKATIALDE